MLNVLSGDRVYQELSQILRYGSEGINLMDSLGFLQDLFPEVTALQGIDHGSWHREGDPYIHTMMTLDAYVNRGGNNPLVLLALLLHDIGKVDGVNGTFHGHEEISAEMAAPIVEKLIGKGLSRQDADTVLWLVANHMRTGRTPEMKTAKRNRLFNDPRFPLLLDVLRADEEGRIPQGNRWVQVQELFNAFQVTFNPVSGPSGPSLKGLGINGHTLMQELNLKPSKELGEALTKAQDYLWENPAATKEEILNVLR